MPVCVKRLYIALLLELVVQEPVDDGGFAGGVITQEDHLDLDRDLVLGTIGDLHGILITVLNYRVLVIVYT